MSDLQPGTKVRLSKYPSRAYSAVEGIATGIVQPTLPFQHENEELGYSDKQIRIKWNRDEFKNGQSDGLYIATDFEPYGHSIEDYKVICDTEVNLSLIKQIEALNDRISYLENLIGDSLNK